MKRMKSNRITLKLDQKRAKDKSGARYSWSWYSNWPSYSDFFQNHAITNRPCSIRGEPILTWKCRQRWRDTRDRASLDDIAKVVPKDYLVPVTDCETKYFDANKCSDWSFDQYLTYWNQNQASRQGSFYLKDWHFRRDFESQVFYLTPDLFASDWLNEYLEVKAASDLQNKNDYRFV